jgi:hypothetical protein
MGTLEKLKELSRKGKPLSLNTGFGTEYSNINTILKWSAVIMQIGCAIMAQFYLSKLLLDVKGGGSEALMIGVALFFLGLFELLKREIVNIWSRQWIKSKFAWNQGVIATLIIALVISAGSFWLTLAGAEKFANKDTELSDKLDSNVSLIEAQIDSVYSQKISVKEREIGVMKGKLEARRSERKKLQKDLRKNSEDPVILEQVQENKGYLKSDSTDLAKLEGALTQLIDSKQKELDKKLGKITDKNSTALQENSSNYLAFLILSIFMELVILGGVFFNRYYDWKAEKEEEQWVSRNEQFTKFVLWGQILEFLFHNDEINGGSDKTVPPKTQIISRLKIRGLQISEKELDGFFQFVTTLGIVQTSGPKRILKKTKEEARAIFESEFGFN